MRATSLCRGRLADPVDTIFRLPVNTPATALPALRARYESVLRMAAELPRIRPPAGADLPALFAAFLDRAYSAADPAPAAQLADNNAVSAGEAPIVAFAFALLGWHAATPDQLRDGMVVCGACFRRLGFWMWPQEALRGSQQGDLQAEVQAGGDEQEALLCDVVEEHRPYCPWQNGKTQNAGAAQYNYVAEGLAGWECLARLLSVRDRAGQESREGDAVERVEGAASRPRTPAAAVEGGGGRVGMVDERTGDEDAEHKERLGRWQRLKKSLALKTSKKA